MNNIPTSYSIPATTINFGSTTYDEKNLTHSIAASGIADADSATGLTNLVTAIKTYIDGTLLAAIGLEFATNDVSVITTINAVTRDHGSNTGDEFSDTDNYIVTFSIEWEKTA